jgi:hypothetical protein
MATWKYIQCIRGGNASIIILDAINDAVMPYGTLFFVASLKKVWRKSV